MHGSLRTREILQSPTARPGPCSRPYCTSRQRQSLCSPRFKTSRLCRSARVGCFLFQKRLPPDHQADVVRPRHRCPVDEVDGLRVWRHVILRAPVPRSDERHGQRVTHTERELAAWLALHRSATKTAFTIDVEKLVSIATPDRLTAAAAGHHDTPR